MNGRARRYAAAVWLAVLAGCASRQVPVANATGDFSVVVGVPAEWLSRVDDASYLDPMDCAALCPATFAKRVSSCHLARVTSPKASADTAAVVCNGAGNGSAVSMP